MSGLRKKDPTWLICCALAVATLAVFWPLTTHDFINFDDEDYVLKNPQVSGGLSAHSVAWAFMAARSSNWHPLTWLSHMLDCQLFGLNPHWHHLSSLVLHAANAILLFLALKRMKQEIWLSALVAALFALHPMHVESVAWIAERKDMLSTFFFLLTLLAYASYAALKNKGEASEVTSIQRRQTSTAMPQGKASASTRKQGISSERNYYFLSLTLFALGLMSKPMLVTLPCVLLLLDFWPLDRFRNGGPGTIARLVLEKVPFLVLSAASSALTCWAQREAMPTLDYLPILDRIGNALIAYTRYIGKLFWPSNLSVFYPHPGTWPFSNVLGAALLLSGITAVVLWKARSQRYLATGWFWFLGTLVPVIGLLQVGSQSLADRYTYIPYIGLFVMLASGATDLLKRFAPTFSPATLLPRIAWALSLTLLLTCAVVTRKQLSYWQNSETLFQHALAVTQDNITAYFSLGKFYHDQGRTDEALAQLQQALTIKADFADVQGQVGQILASQGKLDEAIQHYRKALELKPQLGEALNNLAWLRATHPDPKYRDGAEAVRLAERACEVTKYQRTIFIGTLAAAYAEAGRFPEAINTAQHARDLALKWGENALAARNLQLLELYKHSQPFHEPGI